MYINRFKKIEVVNLLGMYDYYLSGYDLSENILTISGDRGFRNYYVDITFTYVEYLACATLFKFSFLFRDASEEEIAMMGVYAPSFHWYCIEEDTAGYSPQPTRAPFRYFIAARDVEITVYSEKKLDEIVPGLPYES